MAACAKTARRTDSAMPYSTRGHINRGAYTQPFSGVGIEFDPLGSPPDRCGITLHESGFLPDNSEWNFPSVFSPFWRLYHNQRRGHCMVFGEDVVELSPERLVLVPPDQQFHCLGKNPVPHCWLAFSFTRRLAAGHTVTHSLRPSRTEMCLIRDLCRLIEADETWSATDPILHHSLALLQLVLCRTELVWRPPVAANLERVRQFIERHFARPLDTPRLAAEAGMSVTGFARAFQRGFGTSPARYVVGVRVREAARSLLETNGSIDAIADATGFPNRAYFSRVFHRTTREWPAAFRRKHRQPGP